MTAAASSPEDSAVLRARWLALSKHQRHAILHPDDPIRVKTLDVLMDLGYRADDMRPTPKGEQMAKFGAEQGHS